MSVKRITEQASNYSDLDKMTTGELLRGMNSEDKTVPYAVEKTLPQVEKFVDLLVERMKTYGAPFDLVIGLIAGGDGAIRKAVENAEDDYDQGWRDLEKFNIGGWDSVVGIAASGSTPYVVGACAKAREKGLLTGCITCNPGAKVAEVVDIPMVAVVGPEFVTGSTRMKSGTAQKLILNMISTSAMIKLGHVKGNKMVDMQLSNAKLVDRGTRMIMDETGIKDYELAKEYLLKYGSVRNGVDAYKAGK